MAQQNLHSLLKSLASKTPPAETRAKNITRNFAIDLLQRLNVEPEQLQEAFDAHAEACQAVQEGAVPQLSKEELCVLVEELLGGGLRGAKAWRRKMKTRLNAGGKDQARELLKQQLESLFAAIDVDEHGAITFDQLLSFLIECTMKGRVEATHDIHTYNITEAYSLHLHDTGMTHMQYVAQHDMLCASTESGVVRTWDLATLCRERCFIDPAVVPPKQNLQKTNSGSMGSKFLPTQPASAKENSPYDEHELAGGKIVCGTYIPDCRLVAVSSADSHTRFFCPKSSKVKCTFKNEESQVCVAWCEKQRLFYSAGRAGSVCAYKLRFTRDNMRTNMGDVLDDDALGHAGVDVTNMNMNLGTHYVTRPHKSVVHALYTLPNGRLASASLDPEASLHIQEPTRGDVLVSCGGMTAGLLALGFSRDNGLLLAGGFQNHLMAWGWSVGGNRPLRFIDQTTPHSAPIIGVVAIDGTPQVLSGDQGGMVKVWDIRTLQCVQTLTKAQHFEMSNRWNDQSPFQSMMYVPDRRMVLMSSRKRLVFYGYCHSNDRNEEGTVDGAPIVPPRFLAESQLLLTGAGRRVRFWDVTTGSLCASFADVINADDRLTTLAVDPSGSMFYVGTQDGCVKGYTTSNGVMRHCVLPCKSEEIRCLEVMPMREGLKFLLGISWGGSVFTYNICGPTTGGYMSLTSSVFAKQLTKGRSYAYDHDAQIYVIGIRGAFSVWRVTTSYKNNHFQPVYLGTVRTRYQYHISCLSFLSCGADLGLVAAAMGHGQQRMQLWSLYQRTPADAGKPPILNPRLVIEWTATEHTHPLTCIAHNKASSVLYAACEFGKLSAYPLAPVITAFRQKLADGVAEAAAGPLLPSPTAKPRGRMSVSGKQRQSKATRVSLASLRQRKSSTPRPEGQRGSRDGSPEAASIGSRVNNMSLRARARIATDVQPPDSPQSDSRSNASDGDKPARRATLVRTGVPGSPAIDPETGLPLDAALRHSSLAGQLAVPMFTSEDFKVTAIAQVKAHDDGVIGLSAVHLPHCMLVSSGFDRCIRLWNPLLKAIGYLDPYRGDCGYQVKATMDDADRARLEEFEREMTAGKDPEADAGDPGFTTPPGQLAASSVQNQSGLFNLTQLPVALGHKDSSVLGGTPLVSPRSDEPELLLPTEVQRLLDAENPHARGGVKRKGLLGAAFRKAARGVRMGLAFNHAGGSDSENDDPVAAVQNTRYRKRRRREASTRHTDRCGHFLSYGGAEPKEKNVSPYEDLAESGANLYDVLLAICKETAKGQHSIVRQSKHNDRLARERRRRYMESKRQRLELGVVEEEYWVEAASPAASTGSPREGQQAVVTRLKKQAVAEKTIEKVWHDLQGTRDPILTAGAPMESPGGGALETKRHDRSRAQAYRVASPQSPGGGLGVLGALPPVFKRRDVTEVRGLKTFRHPKGKKTPVLPKGFP